MSDDGNFVPNTVWNSFVTFAMLGYGQRTCGPLLFFAYIAHKYFQSMRLFLFASALLICLSGSAQKYYLFIGTYTNTDSKSKGIYVYRFDAATGEASPVSTIATE